MLKSRTLLFCYLFLSLISLITALKCGTFSVHFTDLAAALFNGQKNISEQLIMTVRLPHVMSAFTTGGLLALAGVLMQVLLRNPLADPYILGVSGGASVTTLLAICLGFSSQWQPLYAFVGAIGAMVIVFTITKGFGLWSSIRLLLTGIVMAAGFSAVISLILTLSPDATLHSMLYWLIGDLSFSQFPYLELLILCLGLVVSFLLAPELNILAFGEQQAQSLGVNVVRLQFKLYFLTAILTASAVSLAGSIGFVGLIVPHIVRGFSGSDHRYLIPGAVLVGGSLLTLADMLARTIVAPQELPVGIITALLGVPIFLYLLQKGYKH